VLINKINTLLKSMQSNMLKSGIKSLIRILLFAAMLLSVTSCFNNTNPAEYVKDVVAYNEGSDGIVIYFVLSDVNGQMTSSEGVFDLVISKTVTDYSGYSPKTQEYELLSSRIEAHLSQFQSATIGMGAFEHKALLYPIGRISYSQFKYRVDQHDDGKIEIRFRQEGRPTITGSTTVMF
jgi:hypothetical protein